MLTLFFAPGSSSMASHIALREIGAAFEGRPISFAKQEHRTPEYLVLNPEGKVPTLLVGGRPLTEAAAILFYLARSFPSAALIPGDVEGQAQAVSWMSFVASTLHTGWIARRSNIAQTRSAFAMADRRLGRNEWALRTYSVADIHLLRLYWRFRNALQPMSEEFPNLSAGPRSGSLAVLSYTGAAQRLRSQETELAGSRRRWIQCSPGGWRRPSDPTGKRARRSSPQSLHGQRMPTRFCAPCAGCCPVP